MKIAISATDSNTGSMVDPRFGRAAWLLIVDSATGALIEAIDNSQSRETAHGAGISAAALIADKGVDAVLTGRVGPKALPILEKAGVRMVNDVSGSIQEAIARYAGKTTEPVPPETSKTPETAAPTPGGCGCGKGQGKGMGGGQGQGRGKCRR
ncbi:MAG: NifB/NifX family molybdenum-iron cluster-binding protein [Proteobacteria bacterium]|nr:NifB/NifX family molybdenum-iron cluster-binding protein [Pseudomonadota bacterium]MBU1139700.1 NifB/NifX family molybdenum-iron cluster-binding protein [Pseudomonadota bacterium]MBU1419702.1 NifB/NifX family molybdenum-iron cluster-binding protein [Pseudomonadota bacterium]MBU1454511.1 NifB/NifX family molybdenum-iron cluster-binding protein [Pseudomonadota bacterium]